MKLSLVVTGWNNIKINLIMITEDYVSNETAKLLKERGFDCIVTRSFFEHDNCYAPCDPSEVPRKDAIAIPTIQMAMKWLREKHNLYVDIILHSMYHTLVYEVRIDKINSPSDIDVILPQISEPTYENACEAAIKYCLENLI